MAVQPIIQTYNLTKLYSGGVRALDHLTLDVYQGEIFGYLGPNGAGKTTTIKLLLDLIRPTEGQVKIFGQDAREHSIAIHRRIGFLPGELNLWKGRTALQIVRYMAGIRGMSDLSYAHQLAQRLKLDLSKRVRDFSSGNKRKLGLVLALMHKPDLLILDEPSSGLDPLMQQEFNQLMLEAKAQGRTVFLSSHVLGEVQAICDRVGILRDGQLKAVESVERLTHAEFRWVKMQLRDRPSASVVESLRALAGVRDVQVDMESGALKLRLSGDFDPLLRALGDAYIVDLRVQEPTLEEIFLNFYGNNHKEAA